MSLSRRVAADLPVLELAIVALGFGLRLVLLGDANMWSDEGLSVWAARQSLDTSALYTAGDVHPPLYFWLLHFWLGWAGSSEFAVRLLSVIAGTAIIPLAGWMCRLIAPASAWIPRLAMLLVATSRFAVWWSQEARMYIFGALFATLSLALAVRLRWRPGGWLAVGYIAAAAAGLWTLYLTVFSLAIQGLYWLWSLSQAPTWRERLRLAATWAGLQAAVLFAFLPWLAFTLPRLPAWSRAVVFDPALFLEIYATLVTVGVSLNVDSVRPAMVTVTLLVLLGLLALLRRSSRRWLALPGAGLLLVLVVLVPPAGVWLVTTMPRSFGKPEARYLIPFAPAVYVVVALAVGGLAGLARRARAPLGLALAAGLVVVSAWSLAAYWSGRYLADEYKSIALTLRDYSRPGDVVVLHTNDTWPAFAYEWNRPFVSTPAADRQDEAGAQDFLAPLWAPSKGVWLVINENALEADPQALVETWLEGRSVLSREWRYGNRRLRFFARTDERAAVTDVLVRPSEPAAVQPLAQGPFGRLVTWEQPLRRIRAGDVAYLFGYVDQVVPGGTLNVWLASQPASSAQASMPGPTPAAGSTRVGLAVLPPADATAGATQWVASLGGPGQVVGAVEIVAPPADAGEVAAPERPVQASFGEPPLLRLEGYDQDGAPYPGSTLSVTLHWRALAAIPRSYKVFVHVVGGNGQVAAQRDDFPRQGRRPTTTWRTGEALADTYAVDLPDTLAAGTYRLAVGLYDPATGLRLGPVRVGQAGSQALDQIVIGSLEIR